MESSIQIAAWSLRYINTEHIECKNRIGNSIGDAGING